MYYKSYRATEMFELFSGATIFMLLGFLAIYFGYGNEIDDDTYKYNYRDC